MATTTISDAIVGPQDPGTGISSKDDPNSAALVALIAGHQQGTYVPQNGGLGFNNIVTTDGSEQFDLGSGFCYIIDDASTTASERGTNGRPQIQASETSGYNTEIPSSDSPYVVILPTNETGLSLNQDAVNDVYLSVDPTGQNSVTVHYGNGISTPSDPSIQLGTIDSTDGSTTRANDDPSLNVDSVSDSSGNIMLANVVDSGQVALSSGSATVDTTLSATDATFNLAIGVDDPNADAKVSGRLFWDDSAGTYKVEFVESDTSVGNPTVNYDIIRVR